MDERLATELTESRQVAVREELNSLLESTAFRTSKRCREFLEHVVTRTIEGPVDTLKERSLGAELFQLPPDFDTSQHTVVRVTANEVRKKLAQHYLAQNGSPREVRIELPPGSYSAEFRWKAPAVEAAIPPPPPPPLVPDAPPSHSPHWLYPVLIGSVLVTLASALAFSVWRNQPSREDLKTSPAAPIASPAPAASGEDLRIAVGFTSGYNDRSGRTWGPDRFVSGGTTLARPSERIFRTLDPDIYRHPRIGEFRYDIPLKAGTYELHLHFAETGLNDFISAESSGEGQRVFRVSANGKLLMDAFDVVADAAGPNIADERVFRDISPADDGLLHLNFSAMRGSPMLSGIELLPVRQGAVRPIRVRAGWTASWKDSSGQPWQSDSYFLGGNALVRSTNPAQQISSSADDTALYASERWGHFSYALPVAEGRYRVVLRFCEGHYGRRNRNGGGVGSRVFDVYCNGVALLRNFDIYKEAGGEGIPLERVFAGIRPTAQGKIILTFVPINGMACVNGIEVVDDSR